MERSRPSLQGSPFPASYVCTLCFPELRSLSNCTRACARDAAIGWRRSHSRDRDGRVTTIATVDQNVTWYNGRDPTGRS